MSNPAAHRTKTETRRPPELIGRTALAAAEIRELQMEADRLRFLAVELLSTLHRACEALKTNNHNLTEIIAIAKTYLQPK